MVRRPARLRLSLEFTVILLLAALWFAFGVARLRAGTAAVGMRHDVAPTPARVQFERDLDSLGAGFATLETALATPHSTEARRAFREARSAYKHIESLLWFYSPTTAAALNGPVEEDDADAPPGRLGRQADFQTIEAFVFGATSKASLSSTGVATASVRRMRKSIASFRSATALLDVADTSALDAARLELARVATLGIAEFDSDLSGDAIVEAADAIEGLRRTTTVLVAPTSDVRAAGRQRTLNAALDSAAAYLRRQPDVATLNRLRFIVGYVRPAAEAVRDLRRRLDPSPVVARRAWKPSTATPFDADAFDVWAYAPEYAPAAESASAWVALGARMFFDPRLSGPGTRSCASCHVPSLGFTDGLAHARPMAGASGHPLRGTPTLLNAAVQPTLFADERAGTLEDQVRTVLASDAEMNSSAQLAATRLAGDSGYHPLIARAMHSNDATIDERGVRVALAAYLRTLTSLDSRFDRAVRGDTLALSEGERRGFTVFMGKARCGTCHFAPLFSGVMPPDFTRSELEIIGVPASSVRRGATIDPDSGRARVDGLGVHAFAFKTPSLRNVAVTAPYMHNGVFPTLEGVVDFYDAGGGTGIGERLPMQTLPSRRLGLSVRERADLVSFLRSLTDSSAMRCRAVTISSHACRAK